MKSARAGSTTRVTRSPRRRTRSKTSVRSIRRGKTTAHKVRGTARTRATRRRSSAMAR